MFEIVCYTITLVGLASLAIRRLIAGSSYFAYTMPIIFVCVSLAGVSYLTRYFVYQNPENLLDRRITENTGFSHQQKSGLVAGYGACLIMLPLGIIGLINPSMMESIVSKLSPISWFR